MRLAPVEADGALTRLVSRKAAATNIVSRLRRPSSSRTGSLSIANSNGPQRGLLTSAQADGFNERQIFAR